jgi:PilZ domain
MKDRRKNDRNMCAELLTVRWIEEGRGRIEVAGLEDISPNGVCLQLENSIPVATPVSIYYQTGKYRGTVKYCTPNPIGYLIGIAFDKGYRWSKSDFEPSHLLELPSLPQD